MVRDDPRASSPRGEEDPRAAAAARAAEIREHIGDMDEGPDDFYIDADMVPPGWCYEWKRITVAGQEDPAYQVQLARTGWTPVPAKRHPNYMPAGSTDVSITRKGQMLMERPQVITDKARDIELRRARNQVRQREAELNATPEGQFPRDEDPRTRVKMRRSYEPLTIPE